MNDNHFNMESITILENGTYLYLNVVRVAIRTEGRTWQAFAMMIGRVVEQRSEPAESRVTPCLLPFSICSFKLLFARVADLHILLK